MTWRIITADVLDGLRSLPDASVHCCVTSPPYWGLRDYGTDGQLGLESTPEEYVDNMVKVFREVRRVLRDDGTLWLNLGDSYATGGGSVGRCPGGGDQGERFLRQGHINTQPNRMPIPGLKPKDLVGIPWRVAFALQADGWWLRSDIIWAKPNPMPESVTDRPTKAHEYVFLLTKSQRYSYDADAVAEPFAEPLHAPGNKAGTDGGHLRNDFGTERMQETWGRESGRNRRTVWTIATRPFPGAHFAVFPPELPEVCIKAGTSEKGCCPERGAPWERVVERASENRSNAAKAGTVIAGKGHPSSQVRDGHDLRNGPTTTSTTTGWQPTCGHDTEPEPCTVLDPFAGAGTTLMVALRLGRSAIGIELNPTYAEMARHRIDQDCPLFNRTPRPIAPTPEVTP